MESLKQLILYKERNYAGDKTNHSSVADNIGILDSKLSKRIANYLRHGKVLIEFVSPTPDPYKPSDLVRNVVLSDGTYVWDGIILHWVEKYRIRLPQEFIEHVNAGPNKPNVTSLNSAELLERFKLARKIML